MFKNIRYLVAGVLCVFVAACASGELPESNGSKQDASNDVQITVDMAPQCQTPADCLESEACVGGACAEVSALLCETCAADSDCGSGTCNEEPVSGARFCVAACVSGQCPQGFSCMGGQCFSESGTCKDDPCQDVTCDLDEACQPNTGICLPRCLMDADCPGIVCEPDTGVCVQCKSNR